MNDKLTMSSLWGGGYGRGRGSDAWKFDDLCAPLKKVGLGIGSTPAIESPISSLDLLDVVVWKNIVLINQDSLDDYLLYLGKLGSGMQQSLKIWGDR